MTDRGDLTERAGAGARWGLLTAGALQASTVVSTVAASRLLTPTQFAIVATTTVVYGLFSIFTGGGFGLSVVVATAGRKDNASTAFWGAVIVGSILFGLAALTAPLTARAIGSPESAGAIAVMALVLPLTMAGEVLTSVQLRQLHYRRASTVDFVTAAGTSLLPLALLLAGGGPWAVIVSRVVAAAAAVLAMLIVGRWRPRLEVDRQLLRADAGLQGGFLSLSVLEYLAKNADYWVLGRLVAPAQFSAYYLAFTIPVLLRQRVTVMAQQVLTPMLTRVRDQPKRLREGYERITRMVSGTLLPAMAGLALTADLVLRLAFGPQWGAAVTPMRILAVVAAVDAVSASANSLLVATRRSGTAARRALLRAAVLCLCLVPVVWIKTIDAAAWAVMASALVAAVFTQVTVAAITDASPWRIVHVVGPPFIGSLAMVPVVIALRSGPAGELGPVLELTVASLAGAATYATVLRFGFRSYWEDVARSAKVVLKR